jgi:arylsulfatase A-like enzyme
MREVSAGRLGKVVTYFATMIALTLLCVGDGGTEQGVQGLAAQTLEEPPPNIVFVLTDDQFPGSEEQMPKLNTEIVSKGVEFENMTSTFPLCCPGRATIQRGQYVHNTKIYGNSPPAGGWEKFKRLELHRSTVATWLNPTDGGAPNYRTGLFGKYMNNYREEGAPRRDGTVGTPGTVWTRDGPQSTTRAPRSPWTAKKPTPSSPAKPSGSSAPGWTTPPPSSPSSTSGPCTSPTPMRR